MKWLIWQMFWKVLTLLSIIAVRWVTWPRLQTYDQCRRSTVTEKWGWRRKWRIEKKWAYHSQCLDTLLWYVGQGDFECNEFDIKPVTQFTVKVRISPDTFFKSLCCSFHALSKTNSWHQTNKMHTSSLDIYITCSHWILYNKYPRNNFVHFVGLVSYLFKAVHCILWYCFP